jgi:hypothetical protein
LRSEERLERTFVVGRFIVAGSSYPSPHERQQRGSYRDTPTCGTGWISGWMLGSAEWRAYDSTD